MQLFCRGLQGETQLLCVDPSIGVIGLKDAIESKCGIPTIAQRLVYSTYELQNNRDFDFYGINEGCTVTLLLRLNGGIDFQHREGVKFGGGGVMSETQANVDRRERLRKLALEMIDLAKDPYFMKNHLGKYECKLCLTLHNTEGNYLAHTQGKRHQQNLARRAAREARDVVPKPQPAKTMTTRRAIKIGRPGYKVTKSRDLYTRQRSLLFEIEYPEVEENMQPRHRFMSAFEQKIEPPDKNYQYLLFACEPYETIAFKIPNHEVDKGESKFLTNWDSETKKFSLQLHFKDRINQSENMPNPVQAPPRPQVRYT